MQFCLYNKTSAPIYVSEIGMTIGAKSKSRVLTEAEKLAIINSYPGLSFVPVMLETANPAPLQESEVIEEPKEDVKSKRKSR